MGGTFAIVTFGCRVNQADSFQIEEQLRGSGLEPAPPASADLVVVNTCSVTATADQGARQTIRRIARENSAARIVVTGCYATRRPEDLSTLPGVIGIISNPDKKRLVQLTTAERFGDGDGGCGAVIQPGASGRTAFTLCVQTGCEETCSYCIIPATRGASRSLPLTDVLDRVERVTAAGYREIALTGVHLGSYGRDLDPPVSLTELVRRLAERGGDEVRFRISSLEPMDCTDEIIDFAAEGRSIAAHFHLPLQHASDNVLSRMRRPYTLAAYRALVDRIRERIPDAAIGSDVIAGFPGETDRDGESTESYLLASPLTSLHVFPYSDRPGTEASDMGEKVPPKLVRERAQRLRSIGAELSRRFRASQVGRIRPALTIDDGTAAVTDNYLKVRIPPGQPRNQWVNVRIEEGAGELAGVVLGVPTVASNLRL